MHFKKGFFLSLCLLYSLVSFSQISGRVLSNTGQSIPFCNVVLITAADSALVTGTTTDSAGLFQLEIKRPGTFLIRVVYMGYNEKYSKSIAIGTGLNQFDAGNLVLSPNAQMLKGVQVTAEKPFMEHQLDRIVYNIENSIISAGNNGLEVLKKLPGVTVDNDVSIKVRGKPGVMIMMDGRTSYLSAADVANYLKSLDASQIEKIEVITNPSSRYDASGNAVINIILKKDKNLGFNAQVTSSFRLSDVNHGGFANIVANYRTRKLNFFGTYNFASGANSSWLDNKNIFTAPGIPASTFADHSVSRMDGVYNYGRFGIDYTPDKRQTIGILGEGFNANETRQLSDLTSIYNERPAPDSSFSRNGSGAMMGKRVTVNLNYTFKIDSAGKELSANADYGWFANSFNELDRTTYSPGSSLYSQPALLKYSIPGELRIKAFKVDYAQPFGKNTKLELGAKMSQVNSDNNSQYWNVMPGGDVLDTVKTNHFAFTENINAAYFNLSRKFSEKVEAQAGLRGEETQTNGLLFQTNTSTSRKYQNLFPSAFISWKIDSSHTLNASYSRRIDRPDYGSLNPFRLYTSPYSYSAGNPFLKPQYSDNAELTHVYKNFLSVGLGYLYMTDVISDAIHQNDTTHVISRTGNNLGHYEAYNLLVSVTLHPTHWWTLIASGNLFHDHYYGAFQTGQFDMANFVGIVNVSSSFEFKKGWSMELSGFYRSVNIDAVLLESPIYKMDAGIRKRFGHDKGTITLAFSDLFWSDWLTQTEVFQNVNSVTSRYSDSRRVRINISWKIGKSEYERQEKRKSAEEEMNRIKK